MAEMTPMMRQYLEMKEKHPDSILFFRLGDFYEMFDEDAKTAARELNLTLTTRDRLKPEAERTPMCGVPFHSAEGYIARLLEKGYKVAICEQLEDPAKVKGLVKRGVVRIITPGTVTESAMLESTRSNYACAVWADGTGAGAAAFCDVSTGEFCVSECAQDASEHLLCELGRFLPREALLMSSAIHCAGVTKFLTQSIRCCCQQCDARFDYDSAAACLKGHLGALPEGLGEGGMRAAGALLGYIAEMQKSDISHIRRLDVISGGRYMELDFAARRSLELTENLRTGDRKGSLLGVLDRTGTPMGSRTLRAWVDRPLLSPLPIRRRQAAVQELTEERVLRGELRKTLSQVGDLQRLMARVVCGTANARDLQCLGRYCEPLPRLAELLSGAKSAMLCELGALDPLRDVAGHIRVAICDEPPFSVREGGILRTGYVPEVDRLRDLRDHGAERLGELEARERERTGVKKLKVGYNKVFGYYIDVPNSAAASLPDDYVRRQTLVNAERYITGELKELENTLLTARDRLGELEFEHFDKLRRRIAECAGRLHETAEAVAQLDALCALAETAARGGWCCPHVDMSRTLRITAGRHPVVEQMQPDTVFVPNDALLDSGENRVAIVTGPNMAGKSTYMRQTALIVLLAQIGSFVPAESAHIGVVDRVFTRIGASDDLASGRSTFMVEMTEVAEILRRATSQSLLILDEIGRGTSTYDGMAIARAVLEYCAAPNTLGARTMFATHYRELTALEGALEGVRNYSILAQKKDGDLIFLRKVVPGAADNSYGIEVAQLAGVPAAVVARARQYLRQLEASSPVPQALPPIEPLPEPAAPSAEDAAARALCRDLLALRLDELTPLAALNLLHELQGKVAAHENA